MAWSIADAIAFQDFNFIPRDSGDDRMGTWSCKPFGNDSACDWAYDLEDRRDFSLVEDVIRAVLDSGDEYLDGDLAVEAIAAAEVLAKSLGRGTQTDAYTERVDEWLRALTVKPSATLLADARRALDRILGPQSELNELWEESDEHAEWIAAVRAQQAALAG
jgi:hypothetical protein